MHILPPLRNANKSGILVAKLQLAAFLRKEYLDCNIRKRVLVVTMLLLHE